MVGSVLLKGWTKARFEQLATYAQVRLVLHIFAYLRHIAAVSAVAAVAAVAYLLQSLQLPLLLEIISEHTNLKFVTHDKEC